MRNRQTLLSVLTLLCTLCSLTLSTMAFLRADDTAQVDELIAKNAELQCRIDQLTARLSNTTEPTEAVLSAAFSNLVVDSYTADEDSLTVEKLYLQVHLPQSTTEAVTIRRCSLVLEKGSDILYEQDISLLPGESEGSHELTLVNLQLPRPDMAAEDLLELRMEVTLSNDQLLHTDAASWYESADTLYLLAG